MERDMITLVVPCHKNELIKDFLDAWESYKFWDQLIVVEDYPFKTFDCLPVDTLHYSHQEIDIDLGGDNWIISRRDSAIRSYGFIKAYQLGSEIIVTLDSDCYPDKEYLNFIDWYKNNLFNTKSWESSIIGMRVRGLPYHNFGNLPVMLSIGLWTNIPDLDGICQLSQGIPDNFRPPPHTRILPNKQYIPICGMNLAFRREFAPLSYFGLQGQQQPFSRFDDIWFGVIAKKICDHLGWSISVGEPFIKHNRASDPFINLIKEAPGIKFHDNFWEYIDSAILTKTTAVECMKEIGNHLYNSDNLYVKKLGMAYCLWSNLFN